ncbi:MULTISPECIES: hypothetical protein [Trichocoleus]|uniref:Uncharacterized protein n=1 Tax=Trichocoleus desertorum GB2-A4 TaxID=2933944 RepID=A0ABV0JH41_9CYAN|nr:hypothetical protein [Trichocoleus sp. FACHB-46]MBD1862363.1 hypothetical protein [Trichocoleus sp. FACHB-46]
MPIGLAAQQMGPSTDVHEKIYHHWITEEVHQRAWEAAMANPNRPLAPAELG